MKILLFSFLLVLFYTAAMVHPLFAQTTYHPIVSVPGVDGKNDTIHYVQSLYYLSITAGALIAVVKIIFAGVQWMLSDVITSKEKAKKDIQGALLGLVIILSAVLILNTVNPQLTTLNLFANAPGLTPTEANPMAQSGGVKIGDTHGDWCIGSNLLESLFTFSCSDASKADLEQWAHSCINDAKGTITSDFWTGYTCVTK